MGRVAKRLTATEAIIQAVAIEHASGQEYGTCRCQHIQVAHVGRWGRCTGKHGGRWCTCERFQGLNITKQRMLERFGAAVAARLGRADTSMGLVGVAEVAEMAGVKSAAVSNWLSRDLGFPEPVAQLAAGPIFEFHSVCAWLLKTGRNKKVTVTKKKT